MMASASELSLDCPTMEPQDQTQKLEEFLTRLEEERLKIDAFKRELPLCMTLLTNAMEASRQQLQSYRSNQTPRPILEEFISLNNSKIFECSDKITSMSDKANWMTSAQLWSQTSEGTKQLCEIITSSKETDIGLNMSPKLGLNNKQRNGGAFMPFPEEQGLSSIRVSPDLALASCVDKVVEDNMLSEMDLRPNLEHKQGDNVTNDTHIEIVRNSSNVGTTTQAQRKARRCWSPDLHRRFVNALQMLGGSQVATPKQIRELMKVDGLTNDEVKSHLQKYRLHTRRPSPTPQSASSAPPQLVVLGGIWVPSEYAAAVHGGTPPPSLYGSHPLPPHYFHAPPQSAALAAAHQHHHQMQLHMYNPSPVGETAERSPESEVRGSGSIEDVSGSELGERRGLAALRAEGEESNGSEVTLKF